MENNSSLRSALIGLGLLAVGTGIGYWLTPVTTKVVTIEKQVVNKDINTHKVRIKKPDGTVVTTTDTVDKSKTTSDKSSSKTTTRDQRDWLLSGNALINREGKRTYSGSLERRILGEFYAGAIGTSEGYVGVGFSFRF